MSTQTRAVCAARVLVLAALLAAGCGSSDGKKLTNPADTPYAPVIELADFAASATIDNPYMPLSPGSVRVYEGGGERVEVAVLTETRLVMGVACVVVHDQAFAEGELVEDTYDWFAQDDDGNVWYFGEDSHEIDKGRAVSADGSWEAGVDGALPGIAMLARPLASLWYRQEFYAGQAEDLGQVVGLNETVTTPAGTFTGCLKTLDTNALEPGVEEYKWYAPGVGVVREQEVKGGSDFVELIELRP